MFWRFFKMIKVISKPAECEVCSAIWYLNAKNVKPAEIHLLLVEIYSDNVMTDDEKEG